MQMYVYRHTDLNYSPGNPLTENNVVAKQQTVLSSLNIILSHILQLQQASRYMYVKWIRLNISHASDLTPGTGETLLSSWQQTLHFSYHSCRSSGDLNLRLVNDMQRCVCC